jgi:hypothetical protein
MHVGQGNTKSKTEAAFFLISLKEANERSANNTLSPDISLPNNQHIQFFHNFKYLGTIINTELNEDTEIKTCINKDKSTLGAAKRFLSNKDADIRTKHNIYTSLVLNTALLGCKSWNLSAKNKKQLEALHHSTISRILNIQ